MDMSLSEPSVRSTSRNKLNIHIIMDLKTHGRSLDVNIAAN